MLTEIQKCKIKSVGLDKEQSEVLMDGESIWFGILQTWHCRNAG